MIATQAVRFDWRGLHDQIGWDDSDFENWFGESFTYNDQLNQAFPAGGTLHVVTDRGAVNVVPSNDNQIKVVIDKKVHADKQEDADKYNSSTKPQITVSDKVVTVNANTQGAGEHGVSTDMQIFIPRKAAVETQEAANVAAFLLSPRSSGINAQSIVVDAGMSINYFDADVVRRCMSGGDTAK